MLKCQFKAYISNDQEKYIYGEENLTESLISTKTEAFPDSLLSLMYMDVDAVAPVFQEIADLLWSLTTTHDKKYAETVYAKLDELAPQHVYFELQRLLVRWRVSQAVIFDDYTEDVLLRRELVNMADYLRMVQKQLEELFSRVLDIDGDKNTVQEKMTAYYKSKGDKAFRFTPQPINFELADEETFTEVLYPQSIADLVDYHTRECIKREVRMRVCKNCGKYFAISGRSTTEYCDHVFDSKGRTCKEIGAIARWNRSKSDDDVFKEYRREYKKRFAWIKAGKIDSDVFYAWSGEARKKKAACEAGDLSLEEFTQWLKQP